MPFLWISLALLAIFALIILISYICFRIAFYAKNDQSKRPEYVLPAGKEYEPYHDLLRSWIDIARKVPYTEYKITSFDGLTLSAKYYEQNKGAPIELMFHGYRGDSESDLCGGVVRCFSSGHNAFVVDQRAAGKSEGHVISFGINESRDCLSWVEFINKTLGADTKIILTGISMGAATVVTAAGNPLPENVVGAVADCGYSSPKAIICKIIKEMHLPPAIAYPFVKLGARLFGRFNLEESAPIEAAKRCKIPVIFFHGLSDTLVPSRMSEEVYEACSSQKEICLIQNAGHGLCYPVDPEGYVSALQEFERKYL